MTDTVRPILASENCLGLIAPHGDQDFVNVDLLSFRPNSLTWSTNLEKHYSWVLKGKTTFNLVQGGTEVGGTEGGKGKLTGAAATAVCRF